MADFTIVQKNKKGGPYGVQKGVHMVVQKGVNMGSRRGPDGIQKEVSSGSKLLGPSFVPTL